MTKVQLKLYKHQLRRLKLLVRTRSKKKVLAMAFTKGDILLVKPRLESKDKTLYTTSDPSVAKVLGCTVSTWRKRDYD